MSDYVDIQRAVNKHHTNGQVEHNEQAVRWAHSFSRWIKRAGLGCDSILDAGCRTGYAMDAFIEEFPAARVAGVDIVPEFVKRAERRSEATVGDLQALPYDDQEFDWVFCSTAIEHCPDVRKAGHELMRVAKYGVIIITDLEDEGKFKQNPSHFVYHYDPVEWVDEFRQPGWWLMRLEVPHWSRIEMIWMRQEWGSTYDTDKGA